ncbi:MAG TPA: WD40 repeat domain-containing protein, partial [Allocoleopsis sp.]
NYASDKEPQPSPLHTQYIIKSNQGEKQKQNLKKIGISCGVLIVLIFGIVAEFLHQEALEQRNLAIRSQITALNALSEASLITNHQLRSLLASVKASKQLKKLSIQKDALFSETELALRESLYGTQEKNHLEGHQEVIRVAKYSPDGNIIASASWDSTVRIWKANGELLHILRGHSHRVSDVDFSPDGEMIVTAGEDGKVIIWTKNGRLLHSLDYGSAATTSIFSPDRKMIAAGGESGEIKIWNTEGKLIKTIKSHPEKINDLSFAPDGKTIATASSDRTIKLWDVNNSQLKRILTGHTDRVYAINYSPDGENIASASADNTVKIWSKNGDLNKTLSG